MDKSNNTQNMMANDAFVYIIDSHPIFSLSDSPAAKKYCAYL